MKVAGCPRCGDQTLWRFARNRHGDLRAWCQLCGHTWDIPEENPFRTQEEETAA